jgi:hypothetical protein
LPVPRTLCICHCSHYKILVCHAELFLRKTVLLVFDQYCNCRSSLYGMFNPSLLWWASPMQSPVFWYYLLQSETVD